MRLSQNGTGALLLLALLAPSASLAQSPLSSQGLGLPLEPLDARARALGSVGVGLFGSSLLPTDPSAVLEVRLPIASATYQATNGSATLGEQESDASATRFPLVGIAYPVGERNMATLTYGAFLDERWIVESAARIDFEGEEVLVTDRFESDGGVSALKIGIARAVTDRVVVAVSGGMHTGDLTRTFTRQFDSISVGEAVNDFVTSGRWQLRGPTATVGVTVDPVDLVRVSGSVTWSGKLRAEPRDETTGTSSSYSLPLEVRVGGSAVLAPGLSLTAGAYYADWAESDDGLALQGDAGTAWSVGGGLEWAGPNWVGRDFPARVGYRRSVHPFRFEGEEAVESSWAFGSALNLNQVEGIPLARVDMAAERGSRDAGSLSEKYWRFTVSLRLSSG